jgi:hypothetical protein
MRRRVRFSLRWLFAAILFVAISVVALLNANVWWVGAARAALILALSLGAVIAIASKGTTRMFWMGFTIVGAIQFGIMTISTGNSERPYLIWEGAIHWFHSNVAREVVMPDFTDVPTIGQRVPVILVPYADQFSAVAQCILSAMLGLAGGYIACWSYSRRDASQ